jgi:hypothetical protein
MTEKSKEVPQPVRRQPDIVVPVGQPLPTPPGIKWWLQHIINKGR